MTDNDQDLPARPLASGEETAARRSTAGRLTAEQQYRLRCYAAAHCPARFTPSYCGPCGQEWPCTAVLGARAVDVAESMRSALLKAAETFREYERIHRAKAVCGHMGGPVLDPARVAKATENARMAEMCEEAAR